MHRQQWSSNNPQHQGGGGGDVQQQQYQQHPPRYQQQHRAPPHGGGGAPDRANKGGGSNKCGLFGFNSFNQRRVSIPLKSVAIRAHVVDFFARVEVTQHYTFPIAARSAVCAFSAEVEGRKITSEIKENEEAADLYDDAVSSGHGAFAGRSEKPNVFTAVVGNLAPGKQATIHITYVTELGFERSTINGTAAPRLKFSLPSRLAPKYGKKNAQGYNASSTFYQPRPEFKLTIEVDFELSSRIAGIAASQPVSIALPSASNAKVTLGSMVNALKHDFTLLLLLSDKEKQTPTSYGLLEAPATDEGSGEYAAALVVYPRELFPAATGKVAADEDEAEQQTEEEEEKSANEEQKDEEKKEEGEQEKEPKKPAEKKEKPSITDVRLDWGDLADKEQIKNTAVPASIFLSPGVLFLYSVLPKSAIPEGQDKIKVTLKGKLGENEVSHDLLIDVNAARKDALVHQLYARSAIRALERGVEGKNEEEVKKEIIDLSLAYSLSSRYTTFVAVEERQEATEGTIQRRTVPLNGFGYRQPTGGARGGRGRGGFGRGGGPPQRGDRSFYGHDRRGEGAERGERPQHHPRDQRDSGGEGQGWRRGGGRDDSTAYGGGRRGPAPAAAAPRKKLEITEELTDQLVTLKGNDKDYWLLNSALAKLVDKNLTQIVDALVGVPIVDYISNVWATSLAITVLSHSAQGEKHAEVLKRAEAWLEEETKKYFLDSKDKWLAKAKAFLHL